ncbi:MAG: hypothetical protein LBG78_00435 [Azoarcus sp.]|jgi:MSHA biogenesis protein MshI|nr:hypothetical protein [Azoarcus sp.]
MFSFPSSNKPGWMAILPQEGRITLAYVVCRAGYHPEVRGLESFTVDSDDLPALLTRLKAARSLKSYRCVTLLDKNDFQITPLDAPRVPKEERREALRWSLRGVVDYPIETACLGVLEIPASQTDHVANVLLISAAERVVREKASPFETAGIVLDAIDVPELAQRNVAALLEDENRALVFMHLNENGSQLTLTWRGELVAVRRGEISSRHMSSDNPEHRARNRERLVVEIQRTLDNFDRRYHGIPVSKVVMASYPRIDGLATELAENIYVPVREMDLSSVIDFPDVPKLRDPVFQAKNLLAIGAALRTKGA